MAAAQRDREQKWREHDFYEILRLGRSASASEVKKGFKQVALTCHPDKVPVEERAAATRRFQLLAEAYEVLSTHALRRQYDSIRPDAGLCSKSRVAAPVQRPTAHARLERPAPAQPQPRPATAFNEPVRRAEERKPSFNAEPPPEWKAKPSFNAEPPRAPENVPEWRRDAFKPSQPFGFVGPRCDGCDTRCPVVELRKCPQCAKLICPGCTLCAACVEPDSPPKPTTPPKPRNMWADQPPRDEPKKNRAGNPFAVPQGYPEPYSGTVWEAGVPSRQPQPYAGTKASDGPFRVTPRENEGIRKVPQAGFAKEPREPDQAEPWWGTGVDANDAGNAEPQPRAPHSTAQPRGGRHKDDRGQNAGARIPEPVSYHPDDADRAEFDPPQPPQDGEGGWGSASRDRSGSEVWKRRTGSETDDRDRNRTDSQGSDMEFLDILLAMGFSDDDARVAANRTTSVEAAVEFIMMKSPDFDLHGENGGGWYGVMDRIAEIRGPSDVYSQLPSRGTLYAGFEGMLDRAPSGGEVFGAAKRLSERITSLVPPLRGRGEIWEPAAAPTLEDAPAGIAVDIAVDLVALGFTDEQAKAAARRCSSVEAAVDWISNNPNLHGGPQMHGGLQTTSL